MSLKQLWVLAGGNGAGKSTFYKLKLAPRGIPFINADNIAKELYSDDAEARSYDAAKAAERMREELLIEGRTFCFETVFSHPSKVDFIAKAKAYGFQVVLVFIHLDSSDLNQARVSQRVTEGGHSVPADKIKARIPRVLENVKAAIPLCDSVYLLDNSSLDNPFQVIAKIIGGEADCKVLPVPEWVNNLL